MTETADAMDSSFRPLRLIEEVRKRPGLYEPGHSKDRLERLQLWKEVGAALFPNWGTFNKATVYHTVLQIQRKWRSLRDAYNRELRARRSGVRVHRRVYVYFKRMSFLGGFEGALSEDEDNSTAELDPLVNGHVKPAKPLKPRPRRKRRAKASSSDESPCPEEVEMPVFNNVEVNSEIGSDTDKLFLLSFLPEMRQLPPNVKMWTRAQIANVMQEAVACHYSNTQPAALSDRSAEIKRQIKDSSD
ncbi:unnamed protein product, partial [Iphiclides podalirius]